LAILIFTIHQFRV